MISLKRLASFQTMTLMLVCLVFQIGCQSKQNKGAIINNQQTLPDLYDIWDYSAPAETRTKFKELLPLAEQKGDVSYLLQLRTQIARTYSLEATFDSSHGILDDVESQLTDDLPLVKIRYLLERGRAFNSAGDKSKALGLFNEAYSLSDLQQEDFYAVDAAHMIAIATSESSDKEKWNLIAVEIAEGSESKQTQNWLGSLYNNIGWGYFDQDRYSEALMKFEEALIYLRERGELRRINIARWCVAKGYRFVDRIDDALAIQQTLLSEYEQSGASDGYVFEELGELFLIKGDKAKSSKYFAAAYEELSKDSWLLENESKRMERLKSLGKISGTN